jgi:DNA invertase Pin-like site-specific DNA recombinase
MATAPYMPDTYDVLLRVSKMDQRDEDDDSTVTIKDQRDGAHRAIGARGRVGREFKALDHSGWDVYDSPAWREALLRVERGESRGFAIAYDDRLGRNWRKAGRYYDQAEEAGAEIIFANLPGVDYRTDDGRTLTGILAVVAERQYLGARRRGNNIADATMARGVPNRLAYGYRRNADDDGVKTDPTRDAKAAVPNDTPLWDDGPTPEDVARRIWRMALDKMGVAEITNALNREGIPSANGGRWHKSTVASALKNVQYMGWVKLGKNRPVVKGAHVAFVTEAEYKRVQGQWRPVKRTGKMKAGIAGGILTCSGCGQPMRVLGSGDGRVQYGCRTERAGGCERPVYVHKVVADAFVESITLDALENSEIGLAASSRRLAALKADMTTANAELEAFVLHTPASSRMYAAGLAVREETLEKAEAAYAEAAENAEHAEQLPDPSAWANLTAAARARVAGFLVASVVVAPPRSRSKFEPIHDRFTITWADDREPASVGR